MTQVMIDGHMKRGGLLYYKYTCPVVGSTQRIRIDAKGGCPLCGAEFEWVDPSGGGGDG